MQKVMWCKSFVHLFDCVQDNPWKLHMDFDEIFSSIQLADWIWDPEKIQEVQDLSWIFSCW